MLPLLDLHGVRRLDFHMSVVEVSKLCLTSQLCFIKVKFFEKYNKPGTYCNEFCVPIPVCM